MLIIYGNSRSPCRTSKLLEARAASIPHSKHETSSLFFFFVGLFCPPGTGSSRTKSMQIHADPDQDPQHCTVFFNWYLKHSTVNVGVNFPSFPNPIFFYLDCCRKRGQPAWPPLSASPPELPSGRRKELWAGLKFKKAQSGELGTYARNITEKKENNAKAFTLFLTAIEWTFFPFSLM